jgi:hypothetical protein
MKPPIAMKISAAMTASTMATRLAVLMGMNVVVSR